MTPVLKSGQAAKIEIRDLHVAKARESLYQEWLAQGNSGSFADFMAALRGPQADDEAVRRIVAEVLEGRTGQPVLPRDTLAGIVAELIPQRLIDGERLNQTLAELLPRMSAEDFDTEDEVSIKPGRAVSKAEFDEWRKSITAGETVVQAGGRRTLVVNDWFAPEMQADVLSENPQMVHSHAIYEVLKTRAKPGMRIVMHGNFNMEKLAGVEPELFGADGRTPDAPELAATVNGCQPTMILHFDNWNVDFRECRFRVMTMMTDGFAVAGYKGANRANMGRWFTKAVDDIDPNRRAAQDWKVTGGTTGLFPPIDGSTGFAEKGYENAGFNTTTRNRYAGNYRSNALDTRNLKAGGYGGRFPQADGSTSETWQEWRGGLHGNIGSAGYIFQTPEVGRAERETASFVLEDSYARGFITYGFEVGTEAKPNGNPFADNGEVWEYTPQNVFLVRSHVEDCYEGGIQANRFVNLWEINSRVYRMGHPDSGFEYHKPGQPQSAFINDPGYGSSSRRKTAQIGRYIIGGWYIDCARKGIDAHTISGLYIAKVRVKAKIWGIQICFDEIYCRTDEPSQCSALANQFTLRDSEVFSGFKGVDFTNGSFSSQSHKNPAGQRLFEIRFKALVDNVQIFAPIGYFDNYGRGGVHLRDVTATCAYPYGKLPHFNPASSRGFWLGSQNPERYGIPFNIKLEGCTAQNSPQGNYAEGFCIQPVNLLTMRDCIADVTPFVTDTVMPNRYLRGADVVRSGVKTRAFAVSEIAGAKPENVLFDNCVEVDKTAGTAAVSRFEYQTAAPVRAQEEPPADGGGTSEDGAQPAAVGGVMPKVVRFGMETATATVVRDDSGTTEIVMGGNHPPADWSDMADVSGSIKFVKARLKNANSSAGVYPRIKLDLDAATDTTVLTALRVLSLGTRAAVVSLGMSAADGTAGTGVTLEKSADTDKFRIRVNSNYAVSVDGIPNSADALYEYGRWYILAYTAKLGGEYLNLGTIHGGNGQLSADFGEGLTVFRNHTPEKEQLAGEVAALKSGYGID